MQWVRKKRRERGWREKKVSCRPFHGDKLAERHLAVIPFSLSFSLSLSQHPNGNWFVYEKLGAFRPPFGLCVLSDQLMKRLAARCNAGLLILSPPDWSQPGDHSQVNHPLPFTLSSLSLSLSSLSLSSLSSLSLCPSHLLSLLRIEHTITPGFSTWAHR